MLSRGVRHLCQLARMAQPKLFFAEDSTVGYTDVAGRLKDIQNIDTPALVVDRDALNYNLKLLEQCMESFPGKFILFIIATKKM